MTSPQPATAPALIWFREDLRLADNPALAAACESGRPVLCVFILDDAAGRPLGGASRWWLHHSLTALDQALEARGARLVVLKGEAERLIPQLQQSVGARAVFWNRRYEKTAREIDQRLKERLRDAGIAVTSCNGHLLHEPWTVTSKTGQPMKVFTPYWRAARAKGDPDRPIPAPERIVAVPLPDGIAAGPAAIDALRLLPTAPDWAGGLRAAWVPGEAGARAVLDAFLARGLEGYGEARNRPDLPATSRLSPHLRFGEISPRQVWHAVAAHVAATGRGEDDLDKFLSELGWREFSYHLLFHHPDLGGTNFNRRFDRFPWERNDTALVAWQRGRTGYPIVDAGLRQLWTIGWMHNRVRMIVASFLIKHLLIDWREGEAWFWDTLVDADPANNSASWQWVAGSGADAAPYFRIFNPISQGEKFDPDGAYTRHWVPELARLPLKYLQAPWTAPAHELGRAGIVLGETYPRPLVDHDRARARALAAFETLKSAA